MQITPKIVQSYWHHMCREFEIETKSKSDSTLMKMARPITKMSREDWNRFSTMVGHTLYTDIEPGVADERYSLLGQLCAITHECQHRVQSDDEFWYPLDYLVSPPRRCTYEWDAYTANIEICHELTGQMIPVSKIIETLGHYSLGDDDLDKAAKHLVIRSDQIRRNKGPITDAGKVGIALIKSSRIPTDRMHIASAPAVDWARVL